MNILLLGAEGRLGWELGAGLALLGRVIHCGRRQADLTDLDGLKHLVEAAKPRVIVNAAAHTEVDQAEMEPELAHRVNAEVPALLADLAQKTSAWLIHYSTDYVFDGRKAGWYTETDPASPLNAYGRSKLAGDEAIAASGCLNLVFRTGWVFALRGKNFLRAILDLAHKEESLSVTADQFGCPTGAELLSSATVLALNQVLNDSAAVAPSRAGLYNLVSAGETSWHGLAVYAVHKALDLGWPLRVKPENISPAPADHSGRLAERPANSRLSTAKFTAAFGLTPPPWPYYVNRLLRVWTALKALETPAAPAAHAGAGRLIQPLNAATRPRRG